VHVHPTDVLARFDGTPLTPATVDVKLPASPSQSHQPGLSAVGYWVEGVFVGRPAGSRDLILIKTPRAQRVERRPGPLPLLLPPLDPARHPTEVLLCLPVRKKVLVRPALAEIVLSGSDWTTQLRVTGVTLFEGGETVSVTYVPDESVATLTFEGLLPRPRKAADSVVRFLSTWVWPRVVNGLIGSIQRALESRLGRDVVAALTPYLNLLFTAVRAALDRIWEACLADAVKVLVEEAVRGLDEALKAVFAALYPDRVDRTALEDRERVFKDHAYGLVAGWLSSELRAGFYDALRSLARSIERRTGITVPEESVEGLAGALWRPLEVLLKLLALDLMAGS